ncbi:unnamed protein product [Closterium sp. NIES-64]|nr:unnamed protein product [Closterium sp. NIES-64]
MEVRIGPNARQACAWEMSIALRPYQIQRACGSGAHTNEGGDSRKAPQGACDGGNGPADSEGLCGMHHASQLRAVVHTKHSDDTLGPDGQGQRAVRAAACRRQRGGDGWALVASGGGTPESHAARQGAPEVQPQPQSWQGGRAGGAKGVAGAEGFGGAEHMGAQGGAWTGELRQAGEGGGGHCWVSVWQGRLGVR